MKPDLKLLNEKHALVENGYSKCDEFIKENHAHKLKSLPGLSRDETLEQIINKELSEIRDHCGKSCKRNLSRYVARRPECHTRI